MWVVLTANLAVVALFVSSWNHARRWMEGRSERLRSIAFSSLLGMGTVASMLLSLPLHPGIFLDLRSSLIATAGYFAGPWGALITGGIAAAFRASMGGSGAYAGIIAIGVAAVIGLVGHWSRRGSEPSIRHLFWFSLGLAVMSGLGLFGLPIALTTELLARLGAPIVSLNFVATFIAGFVIIQGRQWARERALLRAAFVQAPDFQYIKDTSCRFVAVNETVARHNGFAQPEAMRGMTDFDIAPPQRAEMLRAIELRMLANGDSIENFEEEVEDPERGLRWFATSKSPIRDANGAIIGLAGVTRDITAYKRLETELSAKSDQFRYALQEMSDGLAMFDQDSRLVLCNEQYRSLFPLTAGARQIGAHIKAILAAVVETGEQVDLPADRQGWIETIAASQKEGGEQEIHLCDGRWMRIRTRPTSEGMSMVVVSDITRIKEAEVVALHLSDQLRVLAGTDGLTELRNRRSFDQTLDRELARAVRSGNPVSLLMIDVDHFKAYNDTYGHQAGDECLRAIGHCLSNSTRNGGDTVARYGGEEFAVILADTDEQSAAVAAEKLRLAVRKLARGHKGSGKGIVTISIGVAAVTPVGGESDASELVRRADEALYQAKAAGRDTVMCWGGPPARKTSSRARRA